MGTGMDLAEAAGTPDFYAVGRLRARVAELEVEVNLLHRQRHAAQEDAANARLLAAVCHPAPDVVPVPRDELATLREIVRLLDEARQRYARVPRAGAATSMGDEIDELLNQLFEMGAHPADTRPKPRARALPASRVLGDGEAAVDEEELAALRCLDDAVTINGDGMSTEALGVDWEVARSAKRRLSDIRAAKGGEA